MGVQRVPACEVDQVRSGCLVPDTISGPQLYLGVVARWVRASRSSVTRRGMDSGRGSIWNLTVLHEYLFVRTYPYATPLICLPIGGRLEVAYRYINRQAQVLGGRPLLRVPAIAPWPATRPGPSSPRRRRRQPWNPFLIRVGTSTRASPAGV